MSEQDSSVPSGAPSATSAPARPAPRPPNPADERASTGRGDPARLLLGGGGLGRIHRSDRRLHGRVQPLPVPNVLFSRPRFKVGRPEDFPAGVVDERFKETRGVWVVNQEGRLYALIAICTHLGCPPNWLAENKFKCPRSGYYKNGVNFGPDRGRSSAAISVDPQDGQLVIDKRKFLFEAGQWDDPAPTSRSGREGVAMAILEKPQKGFVKSQVWKSIFRVGIPTDNRKRALAMLGNVVLHLHPVKVKKSGIRMSYTWCMGGTSFFLFLVETITGLLLMFYYRPTVEYAYVDMVDLREAAAFGIMRELHRWARTPW